MTNEPMNKTLLDALLGQPEQEELLRGEQLTRNTEESVPESTEITEAEIPENSTTVDLSVSRWVLSPEQINWDSTEFDTIEKVRQVLIADRYNLIVETDPVERDKRADEILKKVYGIEKMLGIYIDYDEIREGITKYESALLGVMDAITIHEWLKNQISYLNLEKHFASFLEDDNITAASEFEDDNQIQSNNNENVSLEDYVPEDPVVKQALEDSLIGSFMDDHNYSGLLE